MIIVNNLSKRFGEVIAVDRLSFELSEGGSLAILGPSGSGKTTLLRLIAGLEIPDEGEIHIGGTVASKPGWTLSPRYRNVGFVFQRPALWPHMTVVQNILFGLNGMPKKEAIGRARKLLEKVSLNGLGHRYPHQISVGESRRVALARTLAPEPRYLLLDEPLVNLDLKTRRKLSRVVLDYLSEKGECLIYVSHDQDEILQALDHTIRITGGIIENNPQD